MKLSGKQQVTVCPGCGRTIKAKGTHLVEGSQILCSACNSALEVISAFPLELDFSSQPRASKKRQRRGKGRAEWYDYENDDW